LTAGLLHSVENALGEAFENMPLGSQIVPFPEAPETDMTAIGTSFRGRRGRVMLRESVTVSAAGGPAPVADWKPADVTPDISKSMSVEALAAARDSISMAYGVLPAMFNSATTGPLIREAQRHLATWTLSPIAKLLAEECTEKLGGNVAIDVLRPLRQGACFADRDTSAGDGQARRRGAG
jgi:hypothetical protein